MKKIIGLFMLSALVAISCNNEPAQVKKEVIVTPPVIIKEKEPEKPTSITLDKNGVKVESKKINVDVKKQ